MAEPSDRPNRRRLAGGPLVGEAGPAVESYPTGRVCQEDGCDTRLSQYNPDDLCALHKNPHTTQYTRWNQLVR